MPPRPGKSSHSWEVPSHVWEPARPADIEYDGWADGDDTDFEEDSINADEQCFMDHMLGLYYRRKPTAKNFCIAMYYAGRSGVAAAVPFGFRPDASSGHYQRHLDPLMGYKSQNSGLYYVSLPSYNKKDASRCLRNTPLLLPHELIAHEMDSDPSLGLRLDESKHDLPPCCWDHRVVQAHPDNLPIPAAIYLDGVPYSQTDSVIGFWIENLISSRRHLFAL